MSEIRKDKRGRRVNMGPFDTFVKQLQNIAELFPVLSEDEQHKAVKIMRQFTSVITDRFGADIPEDDDSTDVMIVPLDPDQSERNSSNGDDKNLTSDIASSVCSQKTDTSTDNNGLSHVPKTEPGEEDTAAQWVLQNDEVGKEEPIEEDEFVSVTLTDASGQERVMVVMKSDLIVTEDGSFALSTDVINEQYERGIDFSLLSPKQSTQTGDSHQDSENLIHSEHLVDQVISGSLQDEDDDCNAPEPVNETLPSDMDIEDEMEVTFNDHDLKDAVSYIITTAETSIEPDSQSPQIEGPPLDNIMETDLGGDLLEPGTTTTESVSVHGVLEPTVEVVPTLEVVPSVPEESTVPVVPVKRGRGRPKGSTRGGKKIVAGTCDICGKVVPNKHNLPVHLRTHTGVRPYKCQFCEDSFTTPGNLKRHEAAHRGDKRFECEVCGRRFLEKKSMVMHLRRHTGEKPYSCEICGQKFRQNSSLNVHRKMHEGVKKHQCTECEKSFIQKSALDYHMKRHEEGKTVACPYCTKLFFSEEKMRKHQVRHKNDYTFRCVLCGLMVRTQSGLVKHMTNFHGDSVGGNSYNCIPCGVEFTTKTDLQEHVRSEEHIDVANALNSGGGVSELFIGGVELQEVKEELLFDLDVKQGIDGYKVSGSSPGKKNSLLEVENILDDESLPQVLSKDMLPDSVISRLSDIDDLQNLILTDKNNKIIVLNHIPEKEVDS